MSNVEISKNLSKNLIFGPPVERPMGEMGKFFSPKNSNIVFRKIQEVWKRRYNALGVNSGIYVSAGQFDPL